MLQVVVKPKSAHAKVLSVEKQPRYKTSKLPPRLAKKKEQMEKERKENKGFEMKIENWDNELANNIPAHSDGMGIAADQKGKFLLNSCHIFLHVLVNKVIPIVAEYA